MPKVNWQVRGPRSEEAREEKRQLLLETAARMFNERGFEHTSLTDIAEALGITKPSLYYYVDNKEAIFLSIFEITREVLLRVADEAQQKHLTGREQLKTFMSTYIGMSTSNMGRCVIRLNAVVLAEENARALLNMKRQIDSALRDILRRGIKDGTLATRSPDIASAAIFGAMNWLVFWHKPGESVELDEITGVFLETFLDGLQGKA